MKTLTRKLIVKILDKIEQSLLAMVTLHEMGMSPLETGAIYPAVYTGIWEMQYFTTLAQTKLTETAEIPSIH